MSHSNNSLKNEEKRNFIEYIFEDEKLLAIILRTNYEKKGIDFFTPSDFSQQLGYMNRCKGYRIQPHIHNEVERTINYTQEVLFIKRGVVRVDFYRADNTYLKSNVLNTGDVISKKSR